MTMSDDRGQIYTIEGFASALILVGVLYFIFQSISVVTPQTEMSADMKLSQKSADTLICLDWISVNNSSQLKTAVALWNGGTTSYATRVAPGEDSMRALDAQIAGMMPNDTCYNLEIAYNDGRRGYNKTTILRGVPGDNSAVATRLVTSNRNDTQSAFWNGRNFYPQLVEVRLICWYI